MERDPRRGGDALRLPGTLTDTCAPGECAELPKGCSAHGGTRSSSEGLGGGSAEGAAGRERESNSAGSGAQGAGDTAQDPASPRTGRGQ